MPMALPSGRWSKRTITVLTTLAAAAAGAGAAAAMVVTFGEGKAPASKSAAARHFEAFAITNVSSGSCVGVAADESERRGSMPPRHLRLAACDGTRNQRWTTGKDGKTLQNQAFPGQCAAAVAQRKDGRTIAMRSCQGNDVHQHWRVWNHYAVDGSAHILEPGRSERAWQAGGADGAIRLEKVAKQSGEQQWKFGQAS
ncbi:ricin-type beta-trefoil lectin domain protein [Spirillospora sp. CA-253888]